MARPTRTIDADLAELGARAAEDLAFFDGKRVLVTGGAGFLLSYLVEVLAARGREARTHGRPPPEVVVAD